MISDVFLLLQLLRRQSLGPGRLDRFRLAKLRAIARHAFENVPFYRSAWRSAGLHPSDIRSVADLRKFPVVTKRELKAVGLENTTARGVDLWSSLTLFTSGTTGEPFRIIVSRAEARLRRLLDFRGLLSVGLRPSDRLVFLGPERPGPSRLIHRLGIFRTEFISPRLPVEEQVARLRRTRPTVLWAYPTLLHAVLEHAGCVLSPADSLRIVIASGEMLTPILRDKLSRQNRVGVYNFYGALEVGRIATECPGHDGLHLTADNVILELDHGNRASAAEPWGTAVVTSLNNWAMPIIRYRLDDQCAFRAGSCPCGSSFPLIEPPDGRVWDMITLPSGRLVSPTPCYFVLRRHPEIRRFRVVQESTQRLVLELVAEKAWDGAASAELGRDLRDALPEPMEVEIRLVSSIASDSLKSKTFVSKLATP